MEREQTKVNQILGSDWTPGAPARAPQSWARTPHDGLPLPHGGGLLGQTANGDLARTLIAAGVPGIDHGMGRGEIAEAYAKHLQGIHAAAGTAAVNAWIAGAS